MKPNWTNRKKFLTTKELKHLAKDAGCFTKQQFQDTINMHEYWRKKDPEFSDPCWDCKFIAKKINMKGVSI